MIKLTAQGKFIDTKQIERHFTQGESFSDRIYILIDKVNNDIDVSECTFIVRTSSSDGCMTETLLSKNVQEETILLTWEVPDTVTAVPGRLYLELVGSHNEAIIIKYKMPPIFIKEAVMGTNIPVPDAVEAKLAAMNEMLEDAAEIAEVIGKEGGAVQEVIDARTGSIVQNTFSSLAARLNADFGTCITQGELEKAISSAIITAVKNAAATGVGRFYYDDDGNVCGEIFNKYDDNKAPGQHAHASGHFAHAGGASAFAHGDTAVANGGSAIAIGQSVAAYALNSAALGRAVQAHSTGQHVYGSWSVDDFEGKYCFIFANGTSENERSNGLTLTWDSVLEVKGDVTVPDEDGGEAVSLKAIPDKMAENRSLAESTMGMACRKNMLHNTSSTVTTNGVTFTVNDDGSITVNGTATETAFFNIPYNHKGESRSVILSGCPAGGSSDTYMFRADKAGTVVARDYGNGVTMTSEVISTVTYVAIRINAGYTADNLTFYPLIRYADIADGTYEAYTPSLQEQIDALKAAVVALGGTVSTLEYEVPDTVIENTGDSTETGDVMTENEEITESETETESSSVNEGSPDSLTVVEPEVSTE